MPQTATDSSRRGFLVAGTTIPFSLGYPGLGLDQGVIAGDRFRSGQSLDDFIGQVVGGVTGLPGDLVRPRWQEEPPNLPPIGTDWVAVGVTDSRPLGYPYARESSLPSGDGSQDRADFEEFDVLCSFYGPRADRYATVLRQGLFVAQNTEALYLTQVVFVDASGRTRVPRLIQQRMMERIDITLTFRRTVLTSYPVLYFLSAPIVLTPDTGPNSPRTAARLPLTSDC